MMNPPFALNLNMATFVIFSLFGLLIFEGFGSEEVIVNIKNGKIRGVEMQSEKGNVFYSFRGIPYAEPPIDKLRFMPPVDKKPWNDDVLDATQDGPVCPQIDFVRRTLVGQEDNCLVLNVYTSQLPNENNFSPRVVMVFIHGGGFLYGEGSSSFHNPRSLIDNEIVLVTMNYRLGPLGFLSTGDENAPGNYGLMDQTKALEWVKENIAVFGGDTERITIFGESAGGASVVYQVISSMTKGLFHRAIAMSGSSLCLWAYQDNPLIRAQMLGIQLPCPIDDSEKLIKCLREASAEDITRIGFNFSKDILPLVFTPNFDNNFLKDTPVNLLTKGEFNKDITFMSGVTRDEGVFIYAALNTQSSEFTESRVRKTLEDMVGNSIYTENAVNMIYDRYFKNADISNLIEMRKKLIEMFTHGLFHKCHYKTSLLVSSHGIKTFAYQYDYEAPFSEINTFGTNEVLGVSHGDEMFMLFDGLILNVNLTENDKKIRSSFQTLLTNYAKYGDPTPKESMVNFPQWLPIKNDQINTYHIDETMKSEVYNSKDDDSYEFWNHDIPEAMKKPLDVKDEL